MCWPVDRPDHRILGRPPACSWSRSAGSIPRIPAKCTLLSAGMDVHTSSCQLQSCGHSLSDNVRDSQLGDLLFQSGTDARRCAVLDVERPNVS